MTAFQDLLNDLEAQDLLVLYEYDGLNPDTDTVETVRFSSGPYTTRPSDTPANTPYLDLEDAELSGMFFRSLCPRGNLDGMPEIDTGTDVFTNIDGQLDDYLGWIFEGYPQRKLLGRKDFAYADFGEIQNGITTSVEITQAKMVIRSKSKDALLDLPVQTETFAGTNSGSTGNEGTASDIKGTVKPLCYGECKKVNPVRVNSSAYRDMFHAGDDVQAVDDAYDQGSVLTDPTDYSSTLTGDGIIDLVSQPAGLTTADVKGDASGSGYVDHPVDIAERIATRGGDLTGSDIDSASFAAVKASTSGMVAGIYIRDERSKRDCINEVLDSIRARGVFNRTGKLQAVQITAPDSVATASFNDDAIIDIEAIQSTDELEGIPPYQYILGYDRFWTVQEKSSLATGLTDALKEELGLEYRKEPTAVDTDIQADYPTSKTKTKNTLLVGQANAATQAAADFSFYSTRWRHFFLRVKARGFLVDLGHTIEIDTDRFGFAGGQKAFVYGIGDNLRTHTVELHVMRAA